jgi:hypothetical protein
MDHMKRCVIVPFFLVVSACGLCSGQDGFPVSLPWPTADKPILKFNLGKLQQSGLYNGQTIFVPDVTVQNLSDQPVPKSVFTVFINDKDGVRIGRGLLRLPEIRAVQTEKAQLQFSTAGVPAGATLLNGRTVSLRVVSTPTGARLKIDGQDNGMSPKLADFTVGLHTIELSKEGYAPASSPLEVTGDEVPGGSITFELGGLSQDTIQLRDGSTVLGDVISMSMTSVTIRVEGKEQKYDRNQMKKILLVERITTQQAPVTQPAATPPK